MLDNISNNVILEKKTEILRSVGGIAWVVLMGLQFTCFIQASSGIIQTIFLFMAMPFAAGL